MVICSPSEHESSATASILSREMLFARRNKRRRKEKPSVYLCLKDKGLSRSGTRFLTNDARFLLKLCQKENLKSFKFAVVCLDNRNTNTKSYFYELKRLIFISFVSISYVCIHLFGSKVKRDKVMNLI